jgi:predicted anti-sigma-YlaC factor YlaD
VKTHTHSHQSAECRTLLAQLGDYIDGELEAALCTEIEHHLANCRDCRVLVDTTRKTVSLYQHHHRQHQVELPEEITNRLWKVLREKGCVSQNPTMNDEFPQSAAGE